VRVLNDFRPWRGTLRGELTIAQLLAYDTLSLESAATLWWAIGQGASVFVTAGPPGAGKSTIANALLEFLPEEASVYVTCGGRDRLDLPTTVGPLYLLVNELSAHLPVYLYGEAARHAFDLLKLDTRMLGTLHARSAAEAVRVMCYEAEILRSEVTTPFVFAVVAASWSGRNIVRQVVELGFLAPDGELTTLAQRQAETLHLLADGAAALARWSGLSAVDVARAIDERAARLDPRAYRH
jgi:hypothetical protein